MKVWDLHCDTLSELRLLPLQWTLLRTQKLLLFLLLLLLPQ